MLIYKATNIITKKCYIGQTIKSLNQRMSEHKHRVYKENTNTKFYNSIRKYGWNNFTWEILEESSKWTQEELDAKEKYYIKFYNSIQNGYNILEGGQCSKIDGTQMAILCGSKPFYAFTIKGYLIGEFINKRDFARQYNIPEQRICEMIKNKTLSAKNIIIIDKENYSIDLLQYRINNCMKKNPFVAINKITGEMSEIFTSIEECKRVLNLPSNCHIGEVLKKQRKSSNGYIFKYIEEIEDNAERANIDV